MSDFTVAVEILLLIEGGFVDDPAGGRTNWGITQASWDAYRSQTPALPADVKDISRPSAVSYYQSEWWNRYGIGRISDQHVASALFHLAVNEGMVPATRVLQSATNAADTLLLPPGGPLAEDGQFGPQTVARVNKQDPDTLLFAFLFFASVSYGLIAAARPASLRFLRGWEARLKKELQ